MLAAVAAVACVGVGFALGRLAWVDDSPDNVAGTSSTVSGFATRHPEWEEPPRPATPEESAAFIEPSAELSFEVLGWSRAFDVTVFDHDGDGLLDLLVMVHNIGDDPLWLQTEDGFIASGVTLPWRAPEDWVIVRDRHSCAAADVDGDGALDLYCVRGALRGRSAKSNELWLRQADGTFVEIMDHGAEDPYGRGRTATFLDIDGDGHADLYVTNARNERADELPQPNRVYRNNGDLTFTEVTTVLTADHGANCSPSVGDWNGDGFDDLAICPQDATAGVLYENDGNGGFIDATDLLGDYAPKGRLRDVELVDIDGDGRPDLLWVTPTRVEVFLNRPGTPEARFAERHLVARFDDAPYAVAVADLNRDGIPDLYVAQAGTDCGDPRPVGSERRPNGRDSVLLGPDFQRRLETPYVGWGCSRIVETVGPEAVAVINGTGNYEGPFVIIRPAG